jgi:hypothetical protein
MECVLVVCEVFNFLNQCSALFNQFRVHVLELKVFFLELLDSFDKFLFSHVYPL